jgi:hypothetical protein
MPATADHIRQATRNSQFLSAFDLRTTQHADWAITVAFYIAVHLVEAHFAGSRMHFRRHEDRNREVSVQLPAIETAYTLLYKESRKARYDCLPITCGDAQRALQNWYEPVRSHLCQLLGVTL